MHLDFANFQNLAYQNLNLLQIGATEQKWKQISFRNNKENKYLNKMR